mmetsp:Transcript_130824/g.254927  ORF Transcript_130824/g.254927 Transcript_130824/m.254927 type:complete len:115 (+) Transcript_130824:56-400(+)
MHRSATGTKRCSRFPIQPSMAAPIRRRRGRCESCDNSWRWCESCCDATCHADAQSCVASHYGCWYTSSGSDSSKCESRSSITCDYDCIASRLADTIGSRSSVGKGDELCHDDRH